MTEAFLLFLREVADGTVARFSEKASPSLLQDPALSSDRADLIA